MATDIRPTTDPLEAIDYQAVMDHLLFRKPISPIVRERIRQRAAEVTERVRQQQGTVDIAVDLIRDARNQ